MSEDLFKTNDYVVVRCFHENKKAFKNYVAVVLSCESDGDEYSVKFLKKCGGKFVLSEDEQTFITDKSDIVAKLKEPTLTNSRGQYVFENILKYNVTE